MPPTPNGNRVKSWAQNNRVRGKRKASEALWAQFVTYIAQEIEIAATGIALLQNREVTIQKATNTALDKILQDVLQKI